MSDPSMYRCLVVAASVTLAFLGGCGGGGGSGGSASPPAIAQNVHPVTVDAGPAGIPDLLFTSVTVCTAGGGTQCLTIDHIQVDTGSSGLRIISSVLTPAMSLRQQLDANGNPLVECAQFADGFAWGPVKIADVHIAGEQASSVPIQVIGDPAYATIPSSCSGVGPPENTVETFGANGLLGVGLFLQDCGSSCNQITIPGAYYGCDAAGCQPTRVALAGQVQNPVGMFATDNNGVIVELPAVPSAGAATVSGSLIFGIGTQGNNGLGSVTTLGVDPNTGNLTTLYDNQTYANSYIDSGSSALFFGNNAFPGCTGPGSGLYCPAAAQNLSATLQGVNRATSAVTFGVGNADHLFAANPSYYAFSDLAGPNPDPSSFAWGLPFFFGRSVFTAIEGRSTPAGPGPFIAF